MRNNKRRFEKILAAGLALGSFQGNLAGAALKKPVSRSSSNKSVVDKILSNDIAKGTILATGAAVGLKTFFDIGNGIYNKFKNKDVKSTGPGFVDFENKKISELKGSDIIVHDGKILMSCNVVKNEKLDFGNDDGFVDAFATIKAIGMHDGTRQQFSAAEDEIYKWRKEHKNDREVEVFKYENDANFEKGLEERTIHYLLDSKDGVDATTENKIGLSNDTMFRLDGKEFRFKIDVPDIANLETKVFAKKMVSRHLGQGLGLKEDNITIIFDNPEDDKSQGKMKEYKGAVIKAFAKSEKKPQCSIGFMRIPNENLVIVVEPKEEAGEEELRAE